MKHKAEATYKNRLIIVIITNLNQFQNKHSKYKKISYAK